MTRRGRVSDLPQLPSNIKRAGSPLPGLNRTSRRPHRPSAPRRPTERTSGESGVRDRVAPDRDIPNPTLCQGSREDVRLTGTEMGSGPVRSDPERSQSRLSGHLSGLSGRTDRAGRRVAFCFREVWADRRQDGPSVTLPLPGLRTGGSVVRRGRRVWTHLGSDPTASCNSSGGVSGTSVPPVDQKKTR